MIKPGFRYLKLTAGIAVLAMALIPSISPSTANNQPLTGSAPVPDLVNLTSEERALAKYFDELYAYHKQSAQLSKKATLVSADLEPLQRKSDDLKGRVSGLQNTIREIVRKLRAANEWKDLDTTIAASITDSSRAAKFKQDSFKQLLEDSSNNLTSHGNEINIPLDKLRKRLTSRTVSPYGDGADFQIIRARYEAAPPVKLFRSLGCTIGQIRLGLIGRLKGEPTLELDNQVECACTGFFDGDVPCTQ